MNTLKTNMKLIVCLTSLLMVSCTEVERPKYKGRTITNFISPCQCAIMGSCSVSWTPRNNELYADKTAPEDYNDFGIYIGSMNVPKRCTDI